MAVKQKRKKKKRKANKQPRPLRSLILSFAFTILAVYLTVTAIETIIKIKDTNEQIRRAQSQYHSIVDENKDTTNLLKNADENDIIERIARERLGYVFPDEKVYYDVN